MNKKVLSNLITTIFFFIFFCIGSLIFNDYLVTPDEPLHRINGFISLKYIFELFIPNSSLLLELGNIPDLDNDWRKTYGVLFDLPLSLIEILFNLTIQDAFLLRHFLTFLIFFISTVYFFYLLKIHLKTNNFLSLLGVLILISTPRIFSNSFYNGKDILFLSLIIIATFYCLNLLKNFNKKNLFLACLFCAFASNIRIMGIYLPVLTYIFYVFLPDDQKLKKNINFFLYFFLGYFLILYIIWPFLWLNPLENFFSILKESASYPIHWDFEILYLGNYLSPENLPWHYFFIWFLSTTPIIFVFIILFGIFIFLKQYFNFFLKITFDKNLKLWKTSDQMTSLFIFLCFFIPIFLVITLNSTLYNGWRHLFFVYPFLIYLAIYGLNVISGIFNNNFKNFFITLVVIQIISNVFFIFKTHPVQNIYFNFVSKPYIKNNLPVDYWGLGNKKTIDFLLSQRINFSVANSSFTPLNNLKYSLKPDFSYSKNITFLGTQEKNKNTSDFIFTNYYYNKNPKNMEKFKIPENYKSYYKLIIDGIIVNEVFAK